MLLVRLKENLKNADVQGLGGRLGLGGGGFGEIDCKGMVDSTNEMFLCPE